MVEGTSMKTTDTGTSQISLEMWLFAVTWVEFVHLGWSWLLSRSHGFLRCPGQWICRDWVIPTQHRAPPAPCGLAGAVASLCPAQPCSFVLLPFPFYKCYCPINLSQSKLLVLVSGETNHNRKWERKVRQSQNQRKVYKPDNELLCLVLWANDLHII